MKPYLSGRICTSRTNYPVSNFSLACDGIDASFSIQTASFIMTASAGARYSQTVSVYPWWLCCWKQMSDAHKSRISQDLVFSISYAKDVEFLLWTHFIAFSVYAGLNDSYISMENTADIKVNPLSWPLYTTYFLFNLRSPKSWQIKCRFLKYFVTALLNWKLMLIAEIVSQRILI